MTPLQLRLHERHHGLAQLHEPAVKKMLRTAHDEQLRSGFQAVDPLDGFIHVHELVFITLDNQERTARRCIEIPRKTIDGRRHGDEPIRHES